MTTNDKKLNNNHSSIIDVLKSDIRFRIFSLFNLYPELSLAELKDILSKSKSTIHHHLEKLKEADLIEVSREEKVRGNILKKYYSLKPGYQKKLENTDSSLQEVNKSTFAFYGTYLNFAIRTLEMYKKFFEILEQKKKGYEQLREIMQEEEGFSSMFFFSKEQFKKVMLLFKEFADNLNRIEIESNSIQIEKPYYFFTFGMPLKKVIEEIGKTSLPPSPPSPRSPSSPRPPSPPRKTRRNK
ncbi:MAG: helix-turn-helix domain-containing protein [Promethearchaeota archaeon]